MDGVSTKISYASLLATLCTFARPCSIDDCEAIEQSSLIYLLLMRRQIWALDSRLGAAEGDALANEITHSSAARIRSLGDELSRRTNGGEAQDAGKRR
jgi:hypothetical protein